MSRVLFQATVATDARKELLRWFVKRLDHPGEWPLPAGKVFNMTLAGAGRPITLTSGRCELFGSYWIVDCELAEAPDEETARVLRGA